MLVGVDLEAAQRHEEIAGDDGARVDGDASDRHFLRVAFAEDAKDGSLGGQGGEQLPKPHGGRLRPAISRVPRPVRSGPAGAPVPR
jgi:hypothetical protein